jgi:hypothetical protein
VVPVAVSAADVQALVKARLHLTDAAQDTLIESYVAEIEQRIISYCGIDEVPPGLKWTWASMVIDALRVEQTTVEEIAETADRGDSVKVGDTSVTPMPGSGATNMNKPAINAIVLNYRIDLNRYRKVRW